MRCWIYRHFLSRHLDSGKALPRGLQLHLESCPCCRQEYESQLRVIRQLTADTQGWRQAPSPFLHSRIMGSIAEPVSEPDRPAKSFRFARAYALAGCGVALLLALVLVQRTYLFSPEPESASTAPSLLPRLAQLAPQLNQAGSQKVVEWTDALERPLEREIQLVLGDARSAARLLADNFLPTNP